VRPRTLAAGEKLWARGEPADTIAIVDSGQLTIRDDRQVFGIAFPGTVLGESAILSLEGAPAVRTADVVALSPAILSIYPIDVVRDAFGLGTPRLILRTLYGQICRNALLVIAAQPGQDVAESVLTSLLESLSSCERRFAMINDWQEFMVTFRVLYELREASDVLRRDLAHAPPEPDEMARAQAVMNRLFRSPETIEYLQPFLEAERERRRV
jgi:CRP-like cAMP-binding protein